MSTSVDTQQLRKTIQSTPAGSSRIQRGIHSHAAHERALTSHRSRVARVWIRRALAVAAGHAVAHLLWNARERRRGALGHRVRGASRAWGHGMRELRAARPSPAVQFGRALLVGLGTLVAVDLATDLVAYVNRIEVPGSGGLLSRLFPPRARYRR
jgi:hypothetical protein